ncbi:hypothetical protein FM109_05235 [Vibrio casei]|nr:hypothetical protein FM109_05235 [Vibrio casei]
MIKISKTVIGYFTKNNKLSHETSPPNTRRLEKYCLSAIMIL